MGRRRRNETGGDMLLGTLDMLILRTLLFGPAHGHTIAHAIEHSSDDVLQVEHGSLYPGLYRLEDKGLIAGFWGTSESNRRAKYYRLTPAGRRYLTTEQSRWEHLVGAAARVMGPAREGRHAADALLATQPPRRGAAGRARGTSRARGRRAHGRRTGRTFGTRGRG